MSAGGGTTIPPTGIQWLVHVLPHRNVDWIIEHLQTNGLDLLSGAYTVVYSSGMCGIDSLVCILLPAPLLVTVKELKTLGEALGSKASLSSEMPRYLPASAKKQRRVDFVRRAFYQDATCTAVNQLLLDELSRELRSNSSSNSNGSSRKRPNPNNDYSASSVAVPASDNSAAASAAALYPFPPHNMVFPNVGCDPTNPAYFDYPFPQSAAEAVAEASHFQTFPGMDMDMGMIFHQPATATSSSSAASPPKRFKTLSPNRSASKESSPAKAASHTQVQTEQRQQQSQQAQHPTSTSTNLDHPQTPLEHQLLSELQQMGFPDRREILNAIRAQASSTPTTTTATTTTTSTTQPEPPPSSEQVMMWIVQQREEVEEAQRMDEARLLSEAQSKEQAERVATSVKERLASVKTLPDLCELFADSWILQREKDDQRVRNQESTAAASSSTTHLQFLFSSHRDDLLKLLQLEQQARKWYGTQLPSYYFGELRKSLVLLPQKKERVGPWLLLECQRLETALFQLEEQQGGVPKVFLQAKESHGPDEEEHNAEIELVGRRTTSTIITQPSPERRSNGGNGAKPRGGDATTTEVIEID
jgi:hypothetical protein